MVVVPRWNFHTNQGGNNMLLNMARAIVEIMRHPRSSAVAEALCFALITTRDFIGAFL